MQKFNYSLINRKGEKRLELAIFIVLTVKSKVELILALQQANINIV